MAQVGTLTVDLIAQTASFNSNIEKAARNLNASTNRMNRALDSVRAKYDSVANSARVASLILVGGAFVAGAKKALDYAAGLGEISQQLGVTTRDYQVLAYAATQAGLSQEEMDTGLGKLTASLGKAALGAKAQSDAFAALGISVRNANGSVKTAGEALPLIADALAKVKDPAQRAAAEVAIFGRAGQKLDTILADGSGALKDYAKQAEDAGMIIADPLIKSADAAADKMAALTQQMKVNFANEVAANADAILGLANALQKATIGAIQFINQYPRLTAALAGAAVGSRLGGQVGAVIGAGLGAIGGEALAQSNADSNMDLGFRRRALENARSGLARAMSGKSGGLFEVHSDAPGTSLKAATAEVRKQTALTRQAIALTKNAPAALPPLGENLPDFLASSGGGGRGRKGRAEKSPLDPQGFADQIARFDSDILQAKANNLVDIGAISDLMRQQLTIETDKLKSDVAADVAAGKYTIAQGQQLSAKADQLKAEHLLTINTEEIQRRNEEQLMVQLAANDNQRDMLDAQERLAVTSAERREIGLKLLDLDKAEEKLRLQAVIDQAKIGRATAAEAQVAEDRLRNLDKVYGARAAIVSQSTRGPLESYLADLDPAKVGERVEGLMVDELQSVRDGINNAISNVLGVKDPMLSGLIELFLDQVLIRPIAQALQQARAASSGGGGGGWLGQLIGLGVSVAAGGGGFNADALAATANSTIDAGIAGFSLPGYANGTSFAPAGLALVGERGPEIVRMRGGEQVIPSHRLRGAARNDNPPVSITINAAAGMSDRQARETGAQAYRGYRQAQASYMRTGA